jgi:hypothetical protein
MKELDDKAGRRPKPGQKTDPETEAEILPFRVREKPEPAGPRPVPEAAHSEDHVEPLSNSALLKIGLLIVGLIAGGVWLMNALRDAGRLEDCAMQGRRNCMPISVPDRNQ